MPTISGQSILVIGGSSGIGAAVARLAAAQGIRVSIASSNADRVAKTVKAIQEAEPKAQVQGFTIDLNTDDVETRLEKLFTEVTTSTDTKLDHIIYTANSFIMKPLPEMDISYIRSTSQFALVTPMLIAKLAPRFLNPSYKSSLILTTGVVADKPVKGYTMGPPWASSLMGLTRALALDLAPLRVNIVSPGATNTEMWGTEEQRAQRSEMFSKVALLGKVGTAEEVGEAYLYLMRDSNATGSCVDSNGGALIK
jgi:NAD(P)-dependent dehydrogenase (short-subunit alcohol dehydrogenase family)